MEILDVFNQDAFGVVSLSNLVNDMTPVYGKLGQLGIFTEEGVTQRLVAVDFDPITNQLLPQSSWGGPGIANKSGVANSKSFSIPHFPIGDGLLAADLQGRRRPGSNVTLDMQTLMAKKLREMRTKLEQTREWMRLGVLKGGVVADGAGTTILNVYTALGGSQDSTSFVLGTTTTDVSGKINTVKRNIEQALRGELMSGFVALCSDTFYDAFTSHANVKAAFQYYTANNQNLAGDYRDGFRFGNVLWINYTGSVTDAAGSSAKMIEDDAAYIVPMGTSVFKEWFAPADYMETVNSEGLPFYAKQKVMDFDKGIQVECQSNPLPICLKPKLIQKATIA
jgi:hypothetical protein